MVDERPAQPRQGSRRDVDVRPLGVLALCSSLVGLALSWTYFLSPWAVPPALVGLGLGLVARSDPVTRGAGRVAIVLSTVALAVAAGLVLLV
jgi:hypothetical protein